MTDTPNRPPLSPAAQAVLDAAAQAMECTDGFLPYERELMAAALRAAALVCKRDSAILLSLADELEGAQ